MTKYKTIQALLFAVSFFSCSLFAKDFTVTNNKTDTVDTYSIERLESLPVQQMTTVTPWRDVEDVYDGIYLNDLINMSGFDVNDIYGVKINALNDYTVDILKKSLVSKRYFVTFKRNGKKLSVRQKGPITLILNFSDKGQGNNLLDISYDQVWFVSNIEILQ